MWQGKPVSEWTEEEKNHFFTFFMEECWHDFGEDCNVPRCKVCGRSAGEIGNVDSYGWHPDYFCDLSGFQTIKEWFEKKLPEVWEEYLEYIAMKTNSDINRPFTHCFNKQLSLDNLIQYLLDNQEWMWVECPETCALYAPRKECILENGKTICMNTGKVKHPTLIYAESLKEV